MAHHDSNLYINWKDMKKEYRIREHQNKFYIEIKHIEPQVIGILWWKKKINKESWLRVTINGNASYSFYRFGLYSNDLPPFDTLDEAKDKVKLFLTLDIIHEV